jgi:plasmid stability protein
MSVNLSIKNVPDYMAEELRKRALKNHRSLQGELMAIIEQAVNPEKPLSPLDLLAEIQSLELKTASESAAMVRKDRDAH